MKHNFLFLQGVNSPFFADLAQALKASGQSVQRINFTAGDCVFWRRNGHAVRCKLAAQDLPEFFASYFTANAISNVVLFGDERPVHKAAVQVAKQLGIRIHVFEEGYFRPYWVTLERGGVNANSALPKDPSWYREMGHSVPNYDNGQAFSSSFFMRAWFDSAFHFCSLANRWLFPQYRYHSPVGAWQEYGPYLIKQIRQRMHQREKADTQKIEQLIERKQPFYLLPLQLDTDAQIRSHSRFSCMREVMSHVMASFVAHAPADAVLVVKNHPLDMGLVNHEQQALQLATQYGMADRMVFLQTGSMPVLLHHVKGVVTVNSTVGASSLLHKVPTMAMGHAIYNLPDLCYGGSLDAFWLELTPPDMALFHDFRNVVIHATQINGGFYTASGIKMALKNTVPQLLASQTFIEQHYGK